MTDVCRVDKNSTGFTGAIFRNLPAASGRCSKIVCRIVLSYVCLVLLFDQLKSLLTVKSLQNVIHHKLFCCIFHVLQIIF